MEFFESTVFRVICGCVLVGAFSAMVYMVVRLKKVSGRSQGTAPPPAPQPPAVFLTGRGGAMDFALYDGALVEGLYGIPEPGPDAERVEPESGDIIIVPALCFDRQGYRLGQGGGYYDRWLELHPGLFSVGLCRERFLQERVPREAHDMCVRCVVTEKEAARP